MFWPRNQNQNLRRVRLKLCYLLLLFSFLTCLTFTLILIFTVNLPPSSFIRGYYDCFFKEIRLLGRGAFGSVYLSVHNLDNLAVATYAVKKIPVGDSRYWLSKALKEVRVLERLRHPNVISYYHSWLEKSKTTDFGPEVLCLYVLME